MFGGDYISDERLPAYVRLACWIVILGCGLGLWLIWR